MKQLRSRLTYANVVSTIALFLVLGGATAFAAKQLAKNSVGTKQLKQNAVTAAKIKSGAVTADKLGAGSVDSGAIANGAITGAKLGANAVGTRNLTDGSITAAKLDQGLLGGAHVVAHARGAGPQSRFAGQPYTLNDPTYTQAAGEDDFYVGAATVTVPASCAAPRKVDVRIGLDAGGNPGEDQVVGDANFQDGGNGAVTRLLNFGAFNSRATTRLAPNAPVQHTVSLTGSLRCGEEGDEQALLFESAGIDVIGVR